MTLAEALLTVACALAGLAGALAWCQWRASALAGEDADMLGVLARRGYGRTPDEGTVERMWLDGVREQLALGRVAPETVLALADMGLMGPDELEVAQSAAYSRRYHSLAGSAIKWVPAFLAASGAAMLAGGVWAAASASAMCACAFADRTYRLVPLPGALAYAAFGLMATRPDWALALPVAFAVGVAFGVVGSHGFGLGDALVLAATAGVLSGSSWALLAFLGALAVECAGALVLGWMRRGQQVALCPLLVAPAVAGLAVACAQAVPIA